MESVGDGPFLPGVADCDVLLAALAAFLEMCPLVPDDLPDIGGVAEDGRHAVSGEGAGPVWACPHGVDLIGHGDAAAATGIELVHETDKFGLRLIDLQGRTAVDGHLSVAVGGVGHIAAVLNGAVQTPAQPLVDDLILPAGHEGLELRQLIVDLVGEIVHLLRGDDSGAAVPEGVQNDPLVLHAAPGEAVQVHAQNSVVAPRFHILQQPQHLWPGVQALPADHLRVPVLHQEAVALGALQQSGPVAPQDLLRVHSLLHTALSQVGACGLAQHVMLSHRNFLLFEASEYAEAWRRCSAGHTEVYSGDCPENASFPMGASAEVKQASSDWYPA